MYKDEYCELEDIEIISYIYLVYEYNVIIIPEINSSIDNEC